MKRKLLSILALLLMTATGAWADTTVTWTASDMSGIYIDFLDGEANNNTIKGIKVTASGGGGAGDGWESTDINLDSGSTTITFTSSVGNIKSIAITADFIDMMAPPSGWTLSDDSKLSWSGEASTTVSLPLSGWTEIKNISEIVFTIEPPKVNVTSINLNKQHASMTVGDAALTLTATVYPINATDKTVTWTTSDADVATVANGVVTAKAAGTATITATANDGSGVTGTCEVTVSNPSATLTDGNDLSPLLTYAGKTVDVTYTRAFTAGKPSTVCLPFAYAPKNGEKFYTFTGIEQEGNEYVATMTEHTGATLEANTPYLYKAATTGDTDFSGTYAIPADIKAGTTTKGDWTFVGNYAVTTWYSAPTGIYGFSGKDYDAQGISQGQFVKVGENVSIAPMRCYLKYKDGTAEYQATPQLGRRAGSELPQSIRVRLVNANGEVTSIGEEISVKREDAAAAGWYMLDGRKLSAMPTQKGIYIVNGKKVVIK